MAKDLANKPANSTTISLPPALAAMKAEIVAASSIPELGGSAAAITADIQTRIASATTVDEIFEIANKGTESVSDWVNKPIVIIDFRVLASAEQYKGEESLDAYLLVSFADLETGTEHIMTLGGTILVPMLWKFKTWDVLPIECAFTETTTSAGYTIQKLRPLTATEKRAFEKVAF